MNAAQSVIIANATTRALFGLNAFDFATAGWLRPAPGGGSLTTPMPGNSWGLSASELVTGAFGGGFGQSGNGPWTNDGAGVMNAIKNNLKYNGATALGTMILVPAAFTIGKKLTAKPRRDANKLLKMAGLNTVVKV